MAIKTLSAALLAVTMLLSACAPPCEDQQCIDNRRAAALMMLGVGLMGAGNAMQGAAAARQPVVQPLRCTTNYVGSFAYTNCY